MATPLTDAINSLTTYANSVTGESDTTLSDAVYTLASGYGHFIEPALPSEYQQVEYIQSSGTQYIDTGVSAQNYQKFTIVAAAQDTDSGAYMYIGTRYNTGATRRLIGQYGQKYDFAYGGDSMSVSVDTDVFYQMVMDMLYANYVHYFLDGQHLASVSKSTMTQTITATNYIFAYHRQSDDSAQGKSSIKLKSVKIEESTGLVFNGVPCYRIADGVIGLYDLISGTFLTNAGTGTFSKGADVTS